MKTLLIAGILGAGFCLSGCETAVVENRYPQGNNRYYDNGRNGYGEARYHTQTVQRTNVYETNVQRNDTNRTVVRTHTQGGQAPVNKQVSKKNQTHPVAKVQPQSAKKSKVAAPQKNDKVKPNGGDQPAQQ